jgi:antitoxin FitA
VLAFRWSPVMATLVIRHLDSALHASLKARAAAQGRSMDEEARQILRDGLAAEPFPAEQTLGAAMRALFAPLGGMELPSDLREYGTRPPPDFSGPEWAEFDRA